MTIATVIALLFVATASAATWPMPKTWRAKHYPAWFAEAMCIHRYEGAWNAIGYVGGRATYGGGLQFLLSTWRTAGGTASSVYDIARKPPREQLYRAWIIWKQSGESWRQWGTAGRCGLR